MQIAAPPSKIVLRVHRLSSNNNENDEDQVVPIATNGIVVGNGSHATFKLYNDAEVDAAHGTLECTVGLGIWVYSDHSQHGSILNGNQSVHNDAVVVRHGDRLMVGRTEVKLSLEREKTEIVPKEDSEEKKLVSPVGPNQETELSARNVARMARRRASISWGSAAAVTKLQQAKERLPRIETSGLGFVAVAPKTTPKEYTASPIPETQSRQKWNLVATKTKEAVRRSPPPLLVQHGHSQSFHQPHAQFVPITSICPQPEVENLGKDDHPPPLEYSSSPSVSPLSFAARQRYYLSQQPPTSVASPMSGLIAEVPPPTISTGTWPSSRRDDLRIQVSKKMAAAAPVRADKANVPFVIPKALEFQPPASPVAQRDLLKQQESLQTILQHKFEEEQFLKQQQEEWMQQQHLMSVSSNNDKLPSVKSEIRSLDTDLNELVLYPAPAPVLLRTLSLGLGQQSILKSSPRLSAATQASRARLNSFEERQFNEPRCHDRKELRTTTALVLSPSTRRKWEFDNCNFATEIKLRSSDDSVISTATTILTCHRRVTSSLSSSCTSSVGPFDFFGYEEEEDTEDMFTSYTTSDLRGSTELLRA